MQADKSAYDGDDIILHRPDEVALQEARNGLLQFDEVLRLAEEAAPAKRLTFTAELVLSLNGIAIQGIRRSAGHFRRIPIHISNTPHTPPPYESVPGFVAEMCAYVNANWYASGDAFNYPQIEYPR